MRQVYRNIDKPNRTPEYLMSFLFGYFTTKFMFPQMPFFSMAVGGFLTYVIYRVTANKPEGQMYRVIYRYANLGKFMPTPRKVKRFEI